MIELAAAAAPLIDWGSLLTVAVLAFVIAVVVVSVYSMGVVGVNQWALRARGGNGALGIVLAVVGIGIAIACAAFGLFLVVDKGWTA